MQDYSSGHSSPEQVREPALWSSGRAAVPTATKTTTATAATMTATTATATTVSCHSG